MDSPMKGKIALYFRAQNKQPVTLLDKNYNEVIVPADMENNIYALNILK
jgi:hypothetical protein